MPSFDVISEINFQEVDNAINQAKKELAQRFDFKGSKSEIGFENNEIKLVGDDDYKLDSVKQIVETKLIKRGVSPRSLDYQKVETGSMGVLRQVAKLQNGLTKEKAKEIVAVLKDAKFKAQAAIHEDKVRVTSKSIDELQTVIQFLRGKDLGVPLQFTNMR
jgi:uncharacterized protein YajQ (UPF0234 family)